MIAQAKKIAQLRYNLLTFGKLVNTKLEKFFPRLSQTEMQTVISHTVILLFCEQVQNCGREVLLYWGDTNERIKVTLEDILKAKPHILVCYWECKALYA